MKKKKIPTWHERCEVHPDHQEGMVTYQMIQDRMQEEIDDLRKFVAKQSRQNSKLRRTLEEIAEPYDCTWYKSSHDADDVVDAMIALARMALAKAGGE